MPRDAYTTEEFIEKAQKVHGNKYNYSLVYYKGSKIKIKIICNKHGAFEQIPATHLMGSGCRKCSEEENRDTLETFILKAQKIHNNKYDYSQATYINTYQKITIICPQHGPFEQTPNNHLNGQGCHKCGIDSRTNNKQYFIEQAKLIHGNKYDYSLVDYKTRMSLIKIICPKHGIFEQTAHGHLNGHEGCKKCITFTERNRLENGTFKPDQNKIKSPPKRIRRHTTESLITKFKEIHGNKYDYSLVTIPKPREKVKIICQKHGEFEIRPDTHIRGTGCTKCADENNMYTTEEFISKAKEIHGEEYNYSLVKYEYCNKPVKIICKLHGEFEQKPTNHLSGHGCRKCTYSIHATEDFIKKSAQIHKNKYNYTPTIYTKSINKVEIICPIHGKFEQTARDHLNGQGCPECQENHPNQP
jgi:hypothetical protein